MSYYTIRPSFKTVVSHIILFVGVSAFLSSFAYADIIIGANKPDNNKKKFCIPAWLSGEKYKEEEQAHTAIQKQAREYRNQGLEAQRIGKIDVAMEYFQKANQLDPFYAPIYNDLGIIYEARGYARKAEQNYVKCINIDPSYLGAYSNLALFYENKGDIKRAACYWKKRWLLGNPTDAWTLRAKKRFEDISMVDPDLAQELKEEQVISLYKDVTLEKANQETKSDSELAQDYLKKAKDKYHAGKYHEAYQDTISAMQLDYSNTEAKDLAEDIQKRILAE